MKTIGLVGGVASGKSLAAKMLVDLGAVHLDADRTGHAVLAEDAEVRQALRRPLGRRHLRRRWQVDRRRRRPTRVRPERSRRRPTASFSKTCSTREFGQRLEPERDRCAAAGKPAVVLDAPLLLEAGWGPMCDVVLMIDSPRELRLQRANTRGWTEAEFDRREAAQWPPDEKRRHADVVIPNHGTADDLRHAIARFLGTKYRCQSRT